VNTTDCIRSTIANQANFENRVLDLLRNRAEPLSISDFEDEYMNRYGLATQKTIVLSTVRNCKVFSEVDIHPVLGHTYKCTKNYAQIIQKKIKTNKFLVWNGSN